MPKERSPSSASPLSFSRTRLYFACNATSLGRFAELEAREAAHANVLSGRRGDGGHEVADRLAVVADVRLAQQDGGLDRLLLVAVLPQQLRAGLRREFVLR